MKLGRRFERVSGWLMGFSRSTNSSWALHIRSSEISEWLLALSALLALVLAIATIVYNLNVVAFPLGFMRYIYSGYELIQRQFAMAVEGYGYLFWLVGILLVLIWLSYVHFHRTDESEFQDIISENRKIKLVISAISAFIVGAVLVSIIVARSMYTLPSGGDVLACISTVRMLEYRGLNWAFFATDRPLFYLLLYVVSRFIDIGSPIFWTLVSIVFAIAYLGANLFLLAYSGWTEWKFYSPLVIAATSVSVGFSRMSIDLFSSELGFTLSLLLFGLYFNINHSKSKYKASVFFVFVACILLLSYWYLYLLSIMWIIVMTLLLSKNVRRIILLMLPSLLLFLFFIVVSIIYPPPVYWGIGSAISGSLSKGLPPWAPYFSNKITLMSFFTFNIPNSESIQIALGINDPIFFLLSVTGLMCLAWIRPKPLFFFICLMSITGFAFLAVPEFSLHGATLIPLGMILVLPIAIKLHRNAVFILLLATLLFFPLQTVITYQLRFNAPLVPPSSAALEELTWIKDHIGMYNSSYILLVNDHYVNLWASSFATCNIFYGHLAPAILGEMDPLVDPDNTAFIGSIQRLWTLGISLPIDLSNHHLIVTENTYNPDFYERMYLMEIGPRVYQLQDLNSTELNAFAHRWMDWKRSDANSPILNQENGYPFKLRNYASPHILSSAIDVSTEIHIPRL